jgi:tyrosine-protein phosphatase YwqE
VLNWFRPAKKSTSGIPLTVDVHSHLLPGLDDGVQTEEEALGVISFLQELGYRKLITTPHVISDSYRNTPESITSSLHNLRSELSNRNISITVDAAAEYYLDELLFQQVEQGIPLLTFGSKHLLFETNFMTEPLVLRQFIFNLTTQGYKPILAHPERYMYIQSDFSKAEDLYHRGVLFQLNLCSITGYYSKPAQAVACKLIDRGWVHLVGSDCHNLKQAQLLTHVRTNSYYKKVIALPLLNYAL